MTRRTGSRKRLRARLSATGLAVRHPTPTSTDTSASEGGSEGSGRTVVALCSLDLARCFLGGHRRGTTLVAAGQIARPVGHRAKRQLCTRVGGGVHAGAAGIYIDVGIRRPGVQHWDVSTIAHPRSAAVLDLHPSAVGFPVFALRLRLILPWATKRVRGRALRIVARLIASGSDRQK